jgi:hypothetical protein
MKSRRIALTLGAAGGGVLAAGFLQTAVAFADDYSIVPDPDVFSRFTAIGGVPPLDQAVSSVLGYNVSDLTTGATGSIDGVSLNDLDAFGFDNQEILALPEAINAKVVAAAEPPPTGSTFDAPPTGSLFDTFNYGYGFENHYSDLVGTGTGGTNTITDTFATPFGNFNIPTNFDAAAADSAAVFTYPANSTGDFSYVPTGTENYTSIGGEPLLYQTVSGNFQAYDVNAPGGATVGSFEGVSLHDVDALGQSNQEIMVIPEVMQRYADLINPNDPPVGSFFDTSNYGGGFENVYSDIAATGTGGTNTITDTFVTPFGDVNIPTTFNAAAALPAAEFAYPANSSAADYSYVADPGTAENYTSIGGNPLLDQSVSGQQLYDVDNGTTVVGQFEGVSTNDVNLFGMSNQEIQVTADGGRISPELALPGTTNEPPAGSFFDTFNFGHGFENVYSDIAAAGTGTTNTITDTVVTPFGDFNIPTVFDASLALAPAEFTSGAASTGADLATAFNPADFAGLFGDFATAFDPLSFLSF